MVNPLSLVPTYQIRSSPNIRRVFYFSDFSSLLKIRDEAKSYTLFVFPLINYFSKDRDICILLKWELRI